MSESGIITISSVPKDPTKAKILLDKIENRLVTAHADQAEEIIRTLHQIINGTYVEAEGKAINNNFFEDYEERKIWAEQERSKISNMQDACKNVLHSLELAESQANSQELKYEYRYELVKAKLSLTKLLKQLELDRKKIVVVDARDF